MQCVIIMTRNFGHVFLREGLHMSREERIKIIVEWLKKADDKQLERLQCFIQAFLRAGES